jgi:predicted phosphoribosyltransferase
VDLLELRSKFEVFRDRAAAGACLAGKLERLRGRNALVLGIPRGGVPVAAEVARRLEAELDVAVARKLGAPGQPELGVGAVTADGSVFLNDDIVRETGASRTDLERAIAIQRIEARVREKRFRDGHPAPLVVGRAVILVDDGVATGATIRAAIQAVRRRRPAQLVVAVPVGARQTCAMLRAEADEVVCLYEPEPFLAVGLYYQDFAPTEDAEIERMLAEAREQVHAPPALGASTAPDTASYDGASKHG